MDDLFDFSEDMVSAGEASEQTIGSLWVNKYRPKNLSEMCLEPGIKGLFEAQITDGDLTNMTLVGPPGTGKTTLALVLCNEVKADALFIACASGEGKIDTIQTKIIPFCQYASPRRKVVILDELDSASATQVNSFQKALRNVIEAYPDCRFIATANYADNIIPPILSRLPVTAISFSNQQMLQRISFILKSEKIDLSKVRSDVLRELLPKIILQTFPDVRSLLGKIQMACINGLTEAKLMALCNGSAGDERYDQFFADIIEIIKSKGIPPLTMRQYVDQRIIKLAETGTDSVGMLTNSYAFGKGLLEYLLKNDLLPKSLEIDTLIDMTEQMRVLETCADKETQVFRLLLLARKALQQS